MTDFVLFLSLMIITTRADQPTYFTVWLNDGKRLIPYLDQLYQQNERFNDLLIVDSAVFPYVNKDRINVKLDKPLFHQAKNNYLPLTEKIAKLESIYDTIKPTNPSAASDILRFVAFLGLEGTDEFIYHDVDVRINTGFDGNIKQPISTAVIGTKAGAHLGKNWVMRAIAVPTKEISLVGANINIDFICIVRSKSIAFLTEYIENVCNYYSNSFNTIFISNRGGYQTTFREIITTVPDTSGGDSEIFKLKDIDRYKFITGDTLAEDSTIKQTFIEGVTRRFLKTKMAFGASIAQYERVLQRVFIRDYFSPVPEADEDDPYAVVDRKFVFQNLILHGKTRKILDFILDFVADPKLYGVVSRKNNIDWYGESTTTERDIETLDAPPLTDREANDDDIDSDTDYEEYDEEADLNAIDEGAINIDSASILFCGDIVKRKKRSTTWCDRNDPEKYTIKDDAIVFNGRDEISLVSKFVYIHNLHVDDTTIQYKRYKFSATEPVLKKLILFKQQISTRLEQILTRPSGKQTMYELRNRYKQLVVDTSSAMSLKYIPIYGEISPIVRKFYKLSFAVNHATLLAFSVQFLTRAISSDMDIKHKIALGTIGSVGLAELAYISTLKITGKMLPPTTVITRLGNVFKIFNVATAIYFAVDSSMSLSKNPQDLEAWWWLSRSVTIFTPLNKFFLPLDVTLIVSKQLIGASWELSAQQNHMRLTQTDRSNYYALRFFGISTKWTANVHNGGLFKANIVNPTIKKLRNLLTDNYGVVGFPVTTVCKSTEKIIFNTFNDFETNIDSSVQASTLVSAIVDRLSSTRMETCLMDEQILCAPRSQSGWDWFVSIYAKASRIKNRGADMGVGCIFLDGTVLSGGDPCANVKRIKQDIKDREKVFITIKDSDEYVLPILDPSEYNFKFLSVTNGSVKEFSSPNCSIVLKWQNKIAPYVLVNPRKPPFGRIDYIGIPAKKNGSLNVYTVIQTNPARVYIYKLNKNDRINNFIVKGSRKENEFIVMEIKDYWRLKGKGILIVKPTNNIVYIDNEISINAKLVAENITVAELSGSKIIIAPNTTSPLLHLSSCLVILHRGSRCLPLMLYGSNNTLIIKELSVSYVYLDGHVNMTVENFATVTLNMTAHGSAEIRAKNLARITLIGLYSWTVHKTDNFIQIGRQVRLYAGSMILSFQNYSVIFTVGLKRDTILFYGENVNQTIVQKVQESTPQSALQSIPNILIVRNGSFVEYFPKKSFTSGFASPIMTIPLSFAVEDNSTINITIPYHQTNRQVNIYGIGSSVNIVNEMISCGKVGNNCDTFAHVNCTDFIRICKWK